MALVDRLRSRWGRLRGSVVTGCASVAEINDVAPSTALSVLRRTARGAGLLVEGAFLFFADRCFWAGTAALRTGAS